SPRVRPARARGPPLPRPARAPPGPGRGAGGRRARRPRWGGRRAPSTPARAPSRPRRRRGRSGPGPGSRARPPGAPAPRAGTRRRGTSRRSGSEARRTRVARALPAAPRLPPLLEPPGPGALGGLAEHHQAPAVGQHDLEVTAAQGRRRPPAILDQPLLANGLHGDAADRERRAGAAGPDPDGPRPVDPGHG